MSATTTGQAPAQNSAIDRFFHFGERGTTIGSEIRGGFVTFFTMAYILVLNPIILSGTDSTGKYLGGGDEPNIVAIAAGTALVAGILTILMGAVANYPLALAAGLGLNSMVAYTIIQIPGMTWADGMGIIVLEGVVVLLLVVTGLRQAIFNAVPKFLRTAISVGIGLFVALIGLVNAGLIRPGNGTVLGFASSGSIDSIPLLIFIIGVILTSLFMVKNVRGGILISIIVTTVLAVIVEKLLGLGWFDAEENLGGWQSVPSLNGSPIQVPDFSTLGQFSITGPFQHAGVIAVVVLAFSAMLADFFDTMGTMVAVGAEGDLLDEDGSPYNSQKILLVDSLGAIAGGAGGVSSNTSFVESASGVADGARTGLASIVTGVLFLFSTFLAPLVSLVPSEAAAPALVAVGFLMMQQVVDIDWKDMAIAIPAFLTIILMPFGYSITVGIGVGFVFYALMQLLRGKAKDVHPLMWVVSVMFLIYFLLGPIQSALLG
ncbi:MAG: NCS2 family permease [Actinomycetaceae bacterium]|nr:NCS2 family permease [Actinomycetaceae bacterium]